MYNQLTQDYWVTKQGEKLYPETDMTAEHIVNVMNMLTNRAKGNDEKVKMLRSLLSDKEYNSVRNKLRSTDIISSEDLKETTLFKSLTKGLVSALKNGRTERNNTFHPMNIDIEVPYPDVDVYEF